MREELRKLLMEFVEAVDEHNDEKRNRVHTDFEDYVYPTLDNFIKWLNH